MLIFRKLPEIFSAVFTPSSCSHRTYCSSRALRLTTALVSRQLSSAQPQSKPGDSELHPPSVPGSEVPKTYPTKIVHIVDEISSLTLLEVADLTELLQKRLNIKSPAAFMPAMSMMPAAPSAQPVEEAEEQQTAVKSSFTVKLVKFDASKKVPLIKEIKLIVPEMNLVQAKKFVESAPGNIKVDVSKDEAEEIKKVLEAVGATIEIE